MPGSDLKNIFPAMEFLTASNRKGLGDRVNNFDNGTLNAEGKNTIIIGGGDTGMDCVRTAVRQNAKSVKCLYRRDRENMPGSAREVHNAEEEGVEFIWLSNPKKFIGTSQISSVLVERMKLGKTDSSGRKKPEPIPNSGFEMKADMVINALGFDPEDLPKLFNSPDLSISKLGTIKINLKNYGKQISPVFLPLEIIVRGASLVVWAIRDGRDATISIRKYLEHKRSKNVKAGITMNLYKKNLKKLTEAGAYYPSLEHDACGVGLVASTEGKKSRKIVEFGIQALKAVWHRGAVDADGKTGDGAGIQIEIPADFYKERIAFAGRKTSRRNNLRWYDFFFPVMIIVRKKIAKL